LVYKHGGGFDDKSTAMALGAYGALFGLSCICGTIICNKKDVKTSFDCSALLCASGAVTAGLFYKVHQTAGFMVAPFAAYLGFATFLWYTIWKNESKEKKK